ncbi:hypothetical protein K8T06_12685, partial [bacterium]|nr:hypothetical protein [bacterium]
WRHVSDNGIIYAIPMLKTCNDLPLSGVAAAWRRYLRCVHIDEFARLWNKKSNRPHVYKIGREEPEFLGKLLTIFRSIGFSYKCQSNYIELKTTLIEYYNLKSNRVVKLEIQDMSIPLSKVLVEATNEQVYQEFDKYDNIEGALDEQLVFLATVGM